MSLMISPPPAIRPELMTVPHKRTPARYADKPGFNVNNSGVISHLPVPPACAGNIPRMNGFHRGHGTGVEGATSCKRERPRCLIRTSRIAEAIADPKKALAALLRSIRGELAEIAWDF